MTTIQADASAIVRRVKRDHGKLYRSLGGARVYRDALDVAKVRNG